MDSKNLYYLLHIRPHSRCWEGSVNKTKSQSPWPQQANILMVGDKKKTQFQRVKPGQQVRVAWKSGKIPWLTMRRQAVKNHGGERIAWAEVWGWAEGRHHGVRGGQERSLENTTQQQRSKAPGLYSTSNGSHGRVETREWMVSFEI